MIKYSKKQIKNGILISYLVLISSIVVHLVTTPFYLQHLGQADYGLKSFCLSLASYLTLLSMGMSSSYVRFYTKYEKEGGLEAVKKVNTAYLLFFIIATMIGLVLSTSVILLIRNRVIPLSQYTDDDIGKITLMLSIQVASIMISLLLSIFSLNNSANERYIFQHTLSLFATIANPVTTIILLLKGYGVVMTVLVSLAFTVMQMLCQALYSIFVLKIRFKKFEKSDFRLLKEIIYFSSFIFIIQIVAELNNESDKIILGLMIDASAVTIYQIGVQFRSYLNTLSTSIANSFAPYINRCVLENDKNQINQVFNKISEIQMMLLIFVVGGFVSCGLQFTRAWLGNSFDLSYYIAVCVLVIQTCSYSQSTAVEIQRAMNKHKFRAILYLIVAVLNILISIALCQEIGIMGCVIGTVISYAFQLAVMNVYNHKIIGLNLKYYWKIYMINFALAAVPVFCCLVIGRLQIFTGLNSCFKWTETLIIGSIYVVLFLIMHLLFNRKRLQSMIHSFVHR